MKEVGNGFMACLGSCEWNIKDGRDVCMDIYLCQYEWQCCKCMCAWEKSNA